MLRVKVSEEHSVDSGYGYCYLSWDGLAHKELALRCVWYVSYQRNA